MIDLDYRSDIDVFVFCIQLHVCSFFDPQRFSYDKRKVMREEFLIFLYLHFLDVRVKWRRKNLSAFFCHGFLCERDLIRGSKFLSRK